MRVMERSGGGKANALRHGMNYAGAALVGPVSFIAFLNTRSAEELRSPPAPARSSPRAADHQLSHLPEAVSARHDENGERRDDD